MKLYSAYLNPFQPFPERLTIYGEKVSFYKTEEANKPTKTAIENNLSRAVFSSLAHAEHISTLALFLEGLLKDSQSSQLTAKLQKVIETLSNFTLQEEIAVGLQLAPTNKLIPELETIPRLLVGISSTHNKWTYDGRPAPKTPLPDAWIYIPNTILLIFECKNDEYPLDATQISAYAHHFGLLKTEQQIPNAEPGKSLASPEEALQVQTACRDIVLDASWSTVVKALSRISQEQATGREKWLCQQATTYIKYHIYQPYEGLGTVIEHLKGPRTPERRQRLVELISCLGNDLKGSEITFARKEGTDARKEGTDKWDIQSKGVGSSVFVRLAQNQKSLDIFWLGKEVKPIIWFYMDEYSPEIGMEYYLNISGSHSSERTVEAWNKARKNHFQKRAEFEKQMSEWVQNNSSNPSLQVSVSSVKFNGNSTLWLGGGKTDYDGLFFDPATPQEALEFLIQYRDELWCFPEVSPFATEEEIKAAAKKVRKPAVSLELPLDIEKFRRAKDVKDIQKLLQEALAKTKL